MDYKHLLFIILYIAIPGLHYPDIYRILLSFAMLTVILVITQAVTVERASQIFEKYIEENIIPQLDDAFNTASIIILSVVQNVLSRYNNGDKIYDEIIKELNKFQTPSRQHPDNTPKYIN